MRDKRAIKIAVDAAMSVVLVATMATALVREVHHEWLGVALFVLVGTHMVLNRRWLAAVTRGRYNALRVVHTAAMGVLVACIVGLMASSLVLSKHAFGFLPALPGSSWARRVHMLCSYWAFVAAFAHAGLHARLPQTMAPGQFRMVRTVLALCSCYGLYSFVRLGMPAYLAGQVPFAMVDYETPIALSFARYASVALLVAVMFHFVRAALDLTAKRKRAADAASDR